MTGQGQAYLVLDISWSQDRILQVPEEQSTWGDRTHWLSKGQYSGGRPAESASPDLGPQQLFHLTKGPTWTLVPQSPQQWEA